MSMFNFLAGNLPINGLRVDAAIPELRPIHDNNHDDYDNDYNHQKADDSIEHEPQSKSRRKRQWFACRLSIELLRAFRRLFNFTFNEAINESLRKRVQSTAIILNEGVWAITKSECPLAIQYI